MMRRRLIKALVKHAFPLSSFALLALAAYLLIFFNPYQLLLWLLLALTIIGLAAAYAGRLLRRRRR